MNHLLACTATRPHLKAESDAIALDPACGLKPIAEAPTVTWPGQSGSTYKYWIYARNATFQSKPGNYILSKRNAAGNWVAIYVGQTQDLATRFADHHHEMCIDGQGATHIHVHTNEGGKQARLDEETDLRRKFNAYRNVQ